MRRAMPYPCSGPIACSVFSTISAKVPCHTSALSPIALLSVPMGNPYRTCHRPYGKAIEETRLPGILFQVFFKIVLDRPGAALTVHSLSLHNPSPLRVLDSSATSD